MKGPGINNQDKSASVALCSLSSKLSGVSEAIALCDGFKNLNPSMNVLIKPNLVAWIDKYPYAPFGVITTSAIIEEVIRLLKDFGIKKITVGDGCAQNKELGSETHLIFKRLGYQKLVKKYGVDLIDFNTEHSEEMTLGAHRLKIPPKILEFDFLVNLPALKTHELTKITLGFKNLKGILQPKSKRYCHNTDHTVDEYLFHLAERFYPNLNIIDGTYMLERGPMFTGSAQRTGLLIASRDMLAADIVGAVLMGVKPETVEHLRLFAKKYDRTLDIGKIKVKGLRVNDYSHSLEIQTPWLKNERVPLEFANQDLRGFEIPYPEVLCTGCSYVFPMAYLLVLSGNEKTPFNDYELLAGKAAEPSGKAQKTFLLGNCPIRRHKKSKKINEPIMIPGCPPKIKDIGQALENHGVNINIASVERFFKHLVKKYNKLNFPRSEYWLQ